MTMLKGVGHKGDSSRVYVKHSIPGAYPRGGAHLGDVGATYNASTWTMVPIRSAGTAHAGIRSAPGTSLFTNHEIRWTQEYSCMPSTNQFLLHGNPRVFEQLAKVMEFPFLRDS